jgi:ankyrin repeat protein
LAQLLLAHFAQTDARNNGFGQTPLHLAAEYGHKDVVELLLTNNSIWVDVRDYQGQTPLHLAVAPCAKSNCYREG